MRFFAEPSAKLATPEKKRSLSTFASYSVSAGSYEVIGSNNVVIGQVLSNGLRVKTYPTTNMRRFDVCFAKLASIPENPKFQVRDVVVEYVYLFMQAFCNHFSMSSNALKPSYRRDGSFKMLLVRVNASECATLFDIRSEDILFLANRVENPLMDTKRLNDGETTLMYFMAAQYLFLVIVAIMLLIILKVTASFNIIHIFVLLLVPFFLSEFSLTHSLVI